MFKSMWGWAIISFLLSWMTLGFSNLIFPFFANGLHQNYLLKLGYLGYEKNEN